MRPINANELQDMVNNSDSLSERYQSVIMQRYYVEALALDLTDGRSFMTVTLNEFDGDHCIFNLCDFHENYSFVRALAVELTNHRMNDAATLFAMVAEVCSDIEISFDAIVR